VSLQTELDRQIPTVLGDRVQLQQLVLNLLRNGLDAMDGIDTAKTLLVRSTRTDDGGARVEIADSGVGLSDPDKVFEPFFTTKESGLGMGLAICRSIAEAHDGRLWVAPSLGPGATFCFTLPLQRGPSP
jgi:signal transduction histidine kinase